MIYTNKKCCKPPASSLCIAQAQLHLGQFESALEVCEEALRLTPLYQQHQLDALLHWIKGELLLARADCTPADAEASSLRAIDAARRQSAKSCDLRAATSLARVWG